VHLALDSLSYWCNQDPTHLELIEQTPAGVTFGETAWRRGYDGDGGLSRNAAVDDAHELRADAAGNLYIAAGLRVRRIDALTHTITTVAGNGT
jgi:hypothetical protein